ncbi:MAG: histidine kinase [Bacteroidales bacterium]|nr:histidine kinase [Bacteroidales bacterium]
MQNPLLKNRNSTIAYFFVWLIVICIHTVLLSLYVRIPVHIAAAESLTANVLFAAIGLGLWFPLLYGKPSNEKAFNFIIRHVFACLTTVALWLLIQYLILYSLFHSDTGYTDYLKSSIPWKSAAGILYYWLIILAYYLLVYYSNMKNSLVNEARLETLVRESELNSLKSQINPHFLFNSLNSISSLTMIHPEKAQEMIIKLSDFLRYSVANRDEKFTTLREELENIHRYLDIEKIRFGKRLSVHETVDEASLDMKLPGLILQPLIENAVKYSIYENTEPSAIELVCKPQPDVLLITVRNQYDPEMRQPRGAGLGLQNIKSRLKIIYNREDLMAIRKENNIFEIRIVIPQNKSM